MSDNKPRYVVIGAVQPKKDDASKKYIKVEGVWNPETKQAEALVLQPGTYISVVSLADEEAKLENENLSEGAKTAIRKKIERYSKFGAKQILEVRIDSN